MTLWAGWISKYNLSLLSAFEEQVHLEEYHCCPSAAAFLGSFFG